MEFEWDPIKDRKNQQKHNISFTVAANLIKRQKYLEIPSNSLEEARFKAICSIENDVLVIVFTRRSDKIRIISARRASREERKEFNKFQNG